MHVYYDKDCDLSLIQAKKVTNRWLWFAGPCAC